MLWLCIALPRLPVEAVHPDKTDTAVVVTACEGSTRWILCCNAAAERAHLRPGMSYTVALAVHPRMVTLERNLVAERAALERLAAWAYQFSSSVVLGEAPEDMRRARAGALWLEIGASVRLFGGLRNLITRIEHEFALLLYTYELGIASTLEGASLLARAGIRVALTTTQALCARIRNLPISTLALPREIVRQLHATGVRTIGLLLELPRDAVAKRFGPDVGNFLDRLVAQAPATTALPSARPVSRAVRARIRRPQHRCSAVCITAPAARVRRLPARARRRRSAVRDHAAAP